VLLVPKEPMDAALACLGTGAFHLGAFVHEDQCLLTSTRTASQECWLGREGEGHENIEPDLLRTATDVIRETRTSMPHWQAWPMVRRIKELIERQYTANLRLDTLAREAGVSKFHLLRQFRRQVGIAPHAYQVAVRVARSRELLAHGFCAAEAADRVGFYDQSAYTRAFKRAVGITPAAYAGLVRRRSSGVVRLGSAPATRADTARAVSPRGARHE
jgi:AraC-like DNA-binding protein